MSLAFNILAGTFVVTLLGLMLTIVLIFIMHILMPRKVLETYFKEPYFGPGEIAMLTGLPFAYIRTSMFMMILGFPASGKRRGIIDAHKLAPVWYCKVSKYLVVFLVINFSVFLLCTVAGSIYMLLYE